MLNGMSAGRSMMCGQIAPHIGDFDGVVAAMPWQS